MLAWSQFGVSLSLFQLAKQSSWPLLNSVRQPAERKREALGHVFTCFLLNKLSFITPAATIWQIRTYVQWALEKCNFLEANPGFKAITA